MMTKKKIVMFLSGLAFILIVSCCGNAAITAYNTFDRQVQFDYSISPDFAAQRIWGDGKLTLDPNANATRPDFGKALKVDPNVTAVCWSAVSTGVMDYMAGTVEFWFAPNWNGTNQGGQGAGVVGGGQIFLNNSKTGGAWFTPGLQIFIFNNGYPDDGGQLFAYWDDGWGDDAFIFNSSIEQPASGGTIYGTTKNWELGQWHHIAFCWDATSLGLYMDGGIIMKVARTSMNPLMFSDFFLWGRGYYSGGYRAERSCKGWIDDLVIWNEARYSGDYTPPASMSRIESCQDVWLYGYGLEADLNRDCTIDFLDLLKFVEDWAICNDPVNPECVKTWRQI